MRGISRKPAWSGLRSFASRRRPGRLHEPDDIGALAVEAGEDFAPGDQHRSVALAD